jgi:hypothetical protein
MSEPLSATATLLERIVRLSTERGDGLYPTMLSRLERLRDPRPPRTETEAVAELGHTFWLSALATGLMPPVAEAVLVRIAEHRRATGLSEPEDPWLRARPDRLRQQRDLIMREILFAVWRALWCAREYERTRSQRHLVMAVRSLESAAEAEAAALSPKLVPEMYEAEARCLLAAVSEVLPRFECDFLVGVVTARIEEALKSRPRVQGDGGFRSGMTPDPWLSMRFQVSVQYVDRPSKGRWFATELKEWYEARVAEVRRQDELEAQRKAEEDKRMAEWTALREKERLEEEAKAEQERQLTEQTAAQVAARAEREAAAREQWAQEMLALREQEREQEAALRSERHITIHVVEDGFTVLGQVLLRGFELRFDRESPGWQATVDRDGHSWVDENRGSTEAPTREGALPARPLAGSGQTLGRRHPVAGRDDRTTRC